MSKSKYEIWMDVIKFQSLSQAAYYNNYTVPAISQIIKSLEKELGVTLLNRSHSGVSLTSEGEHLYAYVEKVVQAEAALQEEASKLSGIEGGTIRIGTFSSISSHVLVPIIRDFKSKHPKIHIELQHGDNLAIETMLSRGIVDLGIVDLPISSEFTTYSILKDPFVAVLPANHPCAGMERVPLSVFEEYPVVLFNEDTNKEAAGILRKNRIHANVEYLSSDDPTILSMIEEGMCIGFMGSLILHKTNYNIVTRPTEPSIVREIAFAAKDMAEASPAVHRFLDFALENIRKYTRGFEQPSARGAGAR